MHYVTISYTSSDNAYNVTRSWTSSDNALYHQKLNFQWQSNNVINDDLISTQQQLPRTGSVLLSLSVTGPGDLDYRIDYTNIDLVKQYSHWDGVQPAFVIHHA